MGRLLGIFTSNGGVPKLPIESAEIDYNGIIGDSCNNKKHHGGTMKAICVLENEVLLKLQSEGHPIQAGTTGENILVEGYNLDIGKVFDVGEVRLEVVSDATPCWKIADSFTDGDYSRMSNEKYPSDTRWYCKVLNPGQINISY
ncbi:MAG: MOSC domain-containing protein [Candidatus Thermoplasmatota archaeon]|nr:MOSC domain-containing protein [Candidatus Thermoplasmatota archaeon]